MSSLRTSLTEEGLAHYVSGQLNAMFPDGRTVPADVIRALLPEAMARLAHCFSHVHNKYFFDGTQAVFNHLHGDQYAMFLYILSNTAHRQGAADDVPSKLFLLNKALHGIDAYFEVELPSIFLFVHPLGTVLGRARYSDFLVVYQRCGVGSNHDIYPELGPFFTLRPGAAVLGKCKVGTSVTVAAESLVLDRDIQDDTLYIGNPRDFSLRKGKGKLDIWRT
jgi:serine O-acetyltransferase